MPSTTKEIREIIEEIDQFSKENSNFKISNTFN